MLTVECVETAGWEPALRGMRNPLNSWDRADSQWECPELYAVDRFGIGPNDRKLMERLIHAGGNEHCKFRRMITIWCDVTAPLYWWKQADTYKVGTVTNSCSTMHTLLKEPITIDTFSTDAMLVGTKKFFGEYVAYLEETRKDAVNHFGYAREYERTNPGLSQEHLEKAERFQNELFQMLPEGFNQRRTWEINYEVMASIYRQRKNHKLKEWHQFIDAMMAALPSPWIFTGEVE